jgi:adenylate cyclase
MSIRWKMVLVCLPLIVGPLLVTGYIASLSARNGITAVATEFLGFKLEQLMNYAYSQWDLLVANEMAGDKQFVESSKEAVSSYARTLVKSETELILAVDTSGAVALATSETHLGDESTATLAGLAASGATGWQQLLLEDSSRVAQTARFEPFGWYVLVTQEREAFYRIVDQIVRQTILILAISVAVAAALLLFFSGVLTDPLRRIVTAMRSIIATNDLSARVELMYKDETGDLGHTFNLMTGELGRAYDQVKGSALKAVVAQHREQRIRNIFQKYVPKEVIDQFFENPDTMLTGQDQVLALLFSDIRGFTGISEQLSPAEVVESLNTYFGSMVDIVVRHRGIADKYIGDALMAFFGAPVKHDDDAYQATLAALEMLEALVSFNEGQRSKKRPDFKIGIGLNYGLVTLGNIGSEKKMDYTVIGDMVNVASRMEGLTKVYKEPLIVSESVQRSLKGKLPCRLLDRVVVKGKTMATGIYTVKREVKGPEADAWQLHAEAVRLYYGKSFTAASAKLREVLTLMPQDRHAQTFLQRCGRLEKTPPPDTWTGAVEIDEK